MRLLARSLAPIALLSTASLFFAEAAWAGPITVNIANGEMNFGATSGTNQDSDIGSLSQVGFTHRYNDVFLNVDAVATITDIVNLDSDDNSVNGADLVLDMFDEGDSADGKQISLSLDVFGTSPAAETGFVTFRIDFVEADTNDAATLQNISMRIDDVDSNQFASFAGISAYELSATPATELTVTSTGGAYEFKEPLGASSSSSHQENWVVVEYASASSITITLGAREAGGASFGIAFADTTWSATPTRPSFGLTAYSLTYSGNSATSGSVPGSQNSTTSSSTVVLAAPQGDLLRTTCTFGGWNTRADGTGANYLDADSIALTANTTLFANWTCPPGSGGGGGGESAPPVVPTLAATGPSIAESTVVGTVAGLLVASGLAAIVAQRYVGRRDQRDVHSSA